MGSKYKLNYQQFVEECSPVHEKCRQLARLIEIRIIKFGKLENKSPFKRIIRIAKY